MVEAFTGNLDLASLTLWLFWIFFALLIYYLQRENMREGYPLEDDEGNVSANQGMFPVPDDKTFILPHGKGTLSLPSGQKAERSDLALARTNASNGFPFEPTGDPMADGVGPASWVIREDAPELDARGHAKIVPLAHAEAFHINAGRDPIGLPVVSADKQIVGTVTDVWIDEPESMVRYVEYELEGGGKRLVPITMCRIKSDRVSVVSLYAAQFAGVPATASGTQVTKLEEEKICAYYGGGYLYAAAGRQEPQI
ncbi:MAG: photosynthetic reaction center subunit H [Silicimonas sp.]|jgi:photosynthetic reaction center H subunit|nr:photosynthetic reaction center subunit H [Silicimonas sp.]